MRRASEIASTDTQSDSIADRTAPYEQFDETHKQGANTNLSPFFEANMTLSKLTPLVPVPCTVALTYSNVPYSQLAVRQRSPPYLSLDTVRIFALGSSHSPSLLLCQKKTYVQVSIPGCHASEIRQRKCTKWMNKNTFKDRLERSYCTWEAMNASFEAYVVSIGCSYDGSD